MTKPHSFDDPAGRELLAAIKKIRRMTSGDPKYHSGRKKKEYASPYLEFLPRSRPTPAACHSTTSSAPKTPTGSGTRTWIWAGGS